MNSRVRFALLATLAALAIGLPILWRTSSRLGINPLDHGVEAFGEAVYAKRQSALRAAMTSPAFLERWRAGTLGQGDPVARLIIPRLGVDLIVVEGTSGNSLRAGAGHYEDTALPGREGNAAIAGHRTNFGEPFRHLDILKAGDVLRLVTPEGHFTYQLLGPFDGHANPWVTTPGDWSPIQPTKISVVTLTTAHPPDSSKNRLIARFWLVKREGN